MAMHSSAALAANEAGSLCRTLQGRHSQGYKCLKSRVNVIFNKKEKSGSCYHRSSYIVMASTADTKDSEKTEVDVEKSKGNRYFTMHDMVDPQKFTISCSDEGGKQDWHPARVLSVEDIAAGVRNLTLEAEISREMVPLENAYTTPGSLAQVKINNGKAIKVVPSSPPFPMKANESVLVKARGDISSGMTKQPQFFLSVKHPLELLVFKTDTPQVFSIKEGDTLELGPFDMSGLDLRPILFLARFPTVLFFASGKGIAVAKAIIEAKDNDSGSMILGMRQDIRLLYWSPDPSKVLFQDKFSSWENRKLKVRPAVGVSSGQEWDGHVGSFTSLWDEDDIEYDPSTTAVIVCVDPSCRKEVAKLIADAGIPEKQVLIWQPQL